MDKGPKYLSEKEQDRFEEYLLGRMSTQAATQFQQELEEDSKLSEQFQEFKALFRTIEEAALRNALEDFHNETLPPKNKKTRTTFYRIAAGVAILMALGTGYWLINRATPSERVFETYFSPDPGLPTVMGSQDNYAFYEAMVDYKRGDYTSAIKKWEKLYGSKSEKDTLNYFLGCAHLANGTAESALDYLKRNEHDTHSAFYQESNYFLGLAYLKLNQRDAALPYFKRSGLPKSKEILELISK